MEVTDKMVEAVASTMVKENWLVDEWADQDAFNIYDDSGGDGTRAIIRHFLEVALEASDV